MIKANPLVVLLRGFRQVWARVFGYDVFVSYCRKDSKAVIDPIVRSLERRFLVFRDEAEIDGAEKIPDRIEHELRRSRMLVVVLTQGALRSKWVQRETEYFRKILSKRRKALPVFVSPVDPDAVPSHLNWLTDYKGFFVPTANGPMLLGSAAQQCYRGLRQRVLASASLWVLLFSVTGLSAVSYFRMQVSESRRLASASMQANDADLTLPMKLAHRSYRTWPTFEATSALLGALQRQPALVDVWELEGRTITDLEYSTVQDDVWAAFRDGRIEEYNVRSGRCVRILLEYGSSVNDIEISVDGTLLLSANEDGTVALWDVKPGERVYELEHGAGIRGISISSLKDLAASCDEKGRIRIWQLSTGKILHILNAPRNEEGPTTSNTLFDIEFDPSDPMRLIASGWSEVFVWNLEQDPPQCQPVAVEAGSQTWRIIFDPTGTYFLTGSESGFVKRFGAATLVLTGEAVRPFSQGVIGLAYDSGGQWLSCGSSSGDVSILRFVAPDIVQKKLLGSVGGLAGALAFSPDGTMLAAGGTGGFRLLDVADFQILARVLAAARGPTVPLLATSSNTPRAVIIVDDSVLSWSASLSANKPRMQWTVNGEPRTVALVDQQAIVALKRPNEPVELDDGNRQWHLGPETAAAAQIAFDVHGEVIVTCDADRATHVWDVRTGDLIEGPFQVEGEGMASLAVGPGGRDVLVGDRPATLWRRDGSQPNQIQLERDVHAAAFSPCGRYVAVTGDTEVRVLTTSDGSEVASFSIHGDPPVLALAFSPDSRWLAGGGYGETICIWDIQQEQLLGVPLQGHEHVRLQSIIRQLAFSADGKWLLSAADDGQVLLWDADPESWDRMVRRIVGQ